MTTTQSQTQASTQSAPATWSAVLPDALLTLSLGALELPLATIVALAGAGMHTVADVLRAPAEALVAGGPLAHGRAQDVAYALQRALAEGLAPRQLTASDWPTLRNQLLAPLGELERRWFEEIVGVVGEPPTASTLARRLGITIATLNERADRLRAAFGTLAPDLVERLHHEAATDLRANDGVMQVVHAAVDSIVHRLARSAPEPGFGVRLVAFLFPQECCQARGALFAMTPRRHRRLLRLLPNLVAPRRLPKPVDELLEELRALDLPTARGILVHVLRANLRIAIELDPEVGEVAVADPRTPTARLAELLEEVRKPMSATDLACAYRERYRTGSVRLVRRLLMERGLFLRIGEDLWALRRDHETALAAAAPLVDRIARRLCAMGGRQRVLDLLDEDDAHGEPTLHYVLDGLADDPRVRLLGRGDACPASHRQSLVMTRLLESFRRAGGDVLLEQLAAAHPALAARIVAAGGEPGAAQAIANVPYGWITTEPAGDVFRIGDQAAVIPSLAGEGMAIALASGIAAGEAIAQGLDAARFQRRLARRAWLPVRVAGAIARAGTGGAGGGLVVGTAALLPGLPALAARLSRMGEGQLYTKARRC